MARASSKQAVDLARRGPVGSRIRRDPPPPPPKRLTAGQLRRREGWTIVFGIATLGLIIAALIVVVGENAGWSPADYTIHIRDTR